MAREFMRLEGESRVGLFGVGIEGVTEGGAGGREVGREGAEFG